MPLAILTLLSGLLISGVAIYYSVAGLTSIFAAAVVPIIIMGTSLEVAKLVATVWLKQNWNVAPRLLKAYLLIAVVVLMVITSMGIFGYLSKAHSDQNLVSGDIQARIEIYDQKIQTSRENIEANRRALAQMDAAVDQTLGRSTDEAGANRAVNIRRSQRTERTRLLQEIETEQATIAKLNEEAAPIKAQARQVEAKVGPIKYIAQMIYGDNPDANLLEKSVSWMIIMIVVVFDPLALALLLASQYSFQQLRKKPEEPKDNFAETFLETKGTVDPDINLEFDNPSSKYTEDHKKEYGGDDAGLPEIPEDADMDLVIPDIVRPVEQEVRDIFEQIEDRTMEDMPVVNPEWTQSTTKITHTPRGMIVKDSAGVQEIPTVPDITVLNKDYLIVNGQTIHHSALDPDSLTADDAARSIIGNTYVQNEEQRESSQWSNILGQKNITESEYLQTARKRHNEQ